MFANQISQLDNDRVLFRCEYTSLDSAENNLDALGANSSQKFSLGCNARKILGNLSDVVPDTGEFPVQYQFLRQSTIVDPTVA